MFYTSRGIALMLAFAITILVLAFLSLLEEASPILLTVTGSVCLASSYILTYIVLEFLVFREISDIYKVLEKIQKKKHELIDSKKHKNPLSPLRKIQDSIDTYVSTKNREIEALQKNEAFRREFIADISHELKTPIFAAQGYIHTLLDGAVEDLNVRDKFLKRAAKSMGHLERLVQDLITLNQMESGVIKFSFSHFDLKETVQEVVEQLEDKANRKDVELFFKYDPDRSYLTVGDKDKIYRVIQNLVSNAIKYNKDGGTAEVVLKSHKNSIIVRVKDDGIGMLPEDMKRIFERFYRVEKSRSREQGGTGLGLAIVKHILEGHKAKISVSSIVGKGSVFSFELPLYRKELEKA